MYNNVLKAPVNLFCFTQCFAKSARHWTTLQRATQIHFILIRHPWRHFWITARKLTNANVIRVLGKNTARQMAVTDLAGANTGLRDRATRFAASTKIKLVNRPHIDIFHQSQIIPPGITLRIKLMPSVNQFFCMCPPPAGQNAVQQQFKVVILDVSYIIRTKKLADAAELWFASCCWRKIYGYFIRKFRSSTSLSPRTLQHKISTGYTMARCRTSSELVWWPSRILLAIATWTVLIVNQ